MITGPGARAQTAAVSSPLLDLLPSPWDRQFDQLVVGCASSLILCSPFIGRGPCDLVVDRLRTRPPVAVHFLTDLSADNLVTGVTDPAALLTVVEGLPRVGVRYLPRLHAKVYVRDMAEAIVTSGNLTDAGLRRNFEYGLRVTDARLVTRIREDALGLAELGAEVSLGQLRAMADAAADLKDRYRAAQASRRAELKRELDARLGQVAEALLQLRANSRSLDAIFSETIRFALRNGPLTTAEIHREVRRIHPDLCDDTIDRVINGQHFGKKWKHAVRRAQYHLKTKGRIALNGDRWGLVVSSS
jgi:hypothetical protein